MVTLEKQTGLAQSKTFFLAGAMLKMVMRYICDRCGHPLGEKDLRYIARFEIFAAYDPLQITFEDMTRDYKAEIRQIIAQTERMTEEELMSDVHVELKYDLCRACQQAFLKNPLGAEPTSPNKDSRAGD